MKFDKGLMAGSGTMLVLSLLEGADMYGLEVRGAAVKIPAHPLLVLGRVESTLGNKAIVVAQPLKGCCSPEGRAVWTAGQGDVVVLALKHGPERPEVTLGGLFALRASRPPYCSSTALAPQRPIRVYSVSPIGAR